MLTKKIYKKLIGQRGYKKTEMKKKEYIEHK